jgi:excinuclease UvrABC ATPase subunit
LDKSKSLNEGAILFPEYTVKSWGWSLIINTGLFDPDKQLSKYTGKEMDELLYSKPMKIKTKVGAKDINLTFEGIVARFTNKYIKGDVKTKSERTQKTVAPYMTMGPCSVCRNARLSQAALGCN